MLIGRMPEMRHLHNSCVYCTFIKAGVHEGYIPMFRICYCCICGVNFKASLIIVS
jgi:hypothetical protein